MIEFEIKRTVMRIGKYKGETMYYASPKTMQKMTLDEVENAIVHSTSLTKGDVRNALASLAEVVNQGLIRGASIDLGDLGSIKVVVNPIYKQDAKEISVETGLKKPVVRFYPKEQMRLAASKVQLKIDKDVIP